MLPNLIQIWSVGALGFFEEGRPNKKKEEEEEEKEQEQKEQQQDE